MQTFKYKDETYDVEIAVRRATVRDSLHAATIAQRAMECETDGALGFWNVFGDLAAQVATWKGLPFDPTTLQDQTKEAVFEAYQQYMLLPKSLVMRWKAAVEAADAPADAALAPDPNALAAGVAS
jgi:hypothetical protein